MKNANMGRIHEVGFRHPLTGHRSTAFIIIPGENSERVPHKARIEAGFTNCVRGICEGFRHYSTCPNLYKLEAHEVTGCSA